MVPGDHVKFQTENPDTTVGLFIINPGRLPTIKTGQLCFVMGLREIRASFSCGRRQTGGLFQTDYKRDSAAGLDITSNQYGLFCQQMF
jgi:hypothetical protein